MRHAATKATWTNVFILSHKELWQFGYLLGISLVVASTMLRLTLTGSQLSRLGERQRRRRLLRTTRERIKVTRRTGPRKTATPLPHDFAGYILYTIPRSQSGPGPVSYASTVITWRDSRPWRGVAASDSKCGAKQHVTASMAGRGMWSLWITYRAFSSTLVSSYNFALPPTHKYIVSFALIIMFLSFFFLWNCEWVSEQLRRISSRNFVVFFAMYLFPYTFCVVLIDNFNANENQDAYDE